MNKIEQLRKELNNARDKLVAKGCKWDPDTGNLMDIKPFEIAYQAAIENVFPGCIWWELTNYWDIFDAMVQGVNDKDMIDEIIAHIDPDAFEDDFGCIEEDSDGDPILCKEEAEPEIKYYECEFELAEPEQGTYSICIKGARKPTAKEAESFCKKDMEILGLKKCVAVDEIDHKDAVLSYDMGNEANFPIFGINEPRLGSIEEEDAEASVKLNEGTSNFRSSDYFDLLVFYTYDEFMDIIKYDPEYPNEEQFTTDLGDGDFHVDYDAFEEAKEDFIEKAWDKNEICVLDEDQQERLQDKLDDFNSETKSIARELDEDDAYNLEDIKLRIEPGYYSGSYIYIEHENYFEYISEKVAKEQEKRISDFLESLRNEFGLTKLGVAWGPASNGETGYSIITDSLEEAEKKNKNARFIGNPEAEKSFFNKASGDCAGCSEAASRENKEGKTIKFKNIKAHKRG